MTKLKDFGKEFLSWKWTLWILFLFPYGWKLKYELGEIQGMLGVSINSWDFIIEFICNPLLFMYFLFPLFLLFFSKVILQNWEYMILLRLHSYTRWIFYTLGKIMKSIVVFLVIWIFISCLIALTIPIQLSWSQYATNDFGINYLVFELQRNFSNPYLAVLVQILQYIAFLITVYVVMATCYLFRSKNSTMVISTSGFYFLTIISYKMFTEWIWIQIPNYLFTYYNVTNFNSAYLPFFVLSIIFIACLLLINLLKK